MDLGCALIQWTSSHPVDLLSSSRYPLYFITSALSLHSHRVLGTCSRHQNLSIPLRRTNSSLEMFLTKSHLGETTKVRCKGYILANLVLICGLCFRVHALRCRPNQVFSIIIPIIESGVLHCSGTFLSTGQAMKRLK